MPSFENPTNGPSAFPRFRQMCAEAGRDADKMGINSRTSTR